MTKNILVVDDDTEMCEELREILAREGYRVEIEPDGTKAMARAVNGHYDFVLLDLKLSGTSGAAILQEIRKRRPATKVIIVSASPDAAADGRETRFPAADGIMPKPVKSRLLLERIKKPTS